MNRREAVARVAWLMGGTLSAPTLMAMSRWEQVVDDQKTRPETADFRLDDGQREIVARVSDIIIPKTDTPGAIDVGVPAFMDVMLRDCYKKPAQDAFIAGVRNLESKNFLTLKPDQQTDVLKQVEASSAPSATSPSFWQIIKEVTLLGYFTSEAGIKASFDYQPIPGRFEAIKIKPGQKDFMYGNQV
ncbi:gluconate 2-dehydrogenase subunit 3 family protein [Spirosoma sp. HMF4905]|uniref:Gluconate 2-dehydrogenase subunit 3 family protein n=1 Tax=Spirosoma arboris TaxID=2682092 RepID=A0A7K1S577_9BACT|nr:gluconate 2-dehydrogenase subunit 3 family protein [Spirosoma arboris]MVM28981.1 gluconate 2-dehydrogenase subunit 3 family protein [Spirosoma arboris]